MSPNPVRGAHGVIIVYDISNRSSFDNIKKWNRDCEKYAPIDVYKILVGTKMDLKTNQNDQIDDN